MHQRKLSEKLRRVNRILKDIEVWLDEGGATPSEREEASVSGLLGGVLQKKVLSPENLSSYEEASGSELPASLRKPGLAGA